MSIKYNTTKITPRYLNVELTKVYHETTVVWESFIPQTITFSAGTSLEAWTVPNGVTKLQVNCVASKGFSGGNGGRVQCNLSVSGGQILYFTVGDIPTVRQTAIYNASDIRLNGTELENRIIVAGGGGSGGAGNRNTPGGNGGGTTGANANDTRFTGGGKGGTQSSGGVGGVGIAWTSQNTKNGKAGSFGLGGNGAVNSGTAGAGGAGYYGGGGGCAGYTKSAGNGGAGGGGGSSYTNSTYCTNVTHTQGYQNGAGYITITTMNS